MKRMDTPMNDELLVKYLLGEATPGEQQLVDSWLKDDPSHEQYFADFRLIWDTSKKLAATSTVDEEAAWQRFQQRIADAPKTKNRVMPFAGAGRVWMRVAAVLVLLVGAGLGVYFYNSAPDMQVLASGNQVLRQRLADGSVITLNKHARLYYPETFSGNTRSVRLEGEAFFEVSPDKQHPFIIEAGQAKVRVVGTSFNVTASADRTEVVVETGIVEVAKKERKVSLHPEEQAVVTRDAEEPFKERSEDVLYNYYRTQEFVCNGTPLWRLVDVLNQAYEADIEIANPRVRELRLTTTFRNESLDNILNVVAETLNLQVQREGRKIILQ